MSRFGLQIRAASVADAPELAVLLNAAGYRVDAREVADRLGALRDASGAVLLAWEWGPPSGLVELHWFSTLRAARPTAQITMLFVDVEARRRGIGRLLLKAASQTARVAGCGELEIATTAGDQSLHHFCVATGFAPLGLRYSRSLRKQA
jgi:GNAT superfamily N-acetyltransferase